MRVVLVLGLVLGGCSSSDLAGAERRAFAGGIYKVGNPYKQFGERRVPKEEPNYDRRGMASWYGKKFDGKPTANGETYDMRLYTAAHPTLPMPSWVRVTNLENGRKLIVRLNDRGPFAKGREIDLSRASAQYLGFFTAGSAQVRVQYLGRAPLYDDEGKRISSGATIPKRVLPLGVRVDSARVSRIPRQNPKKMVQRNGGYIVQIGSYSNQESALELARQYESLASWEVSRTGSRQRSVFRVHSPLFANETGARALERQTRAAGHTDVIILGDKE